MPNVIVKTGNKILEINAQQGQNLLELLRKADIDISTPCNGNGTCGKCKVRILSGHLPNPSQNEIKVLGFNAIESGYRLSCCYAVRSDVEILLESDSLQAQIVTEGRQRSFELDPVVTKENIVLEKPSLSSQISDFERVLGSCSMLEVNTPSLQLIRNIPELIRQKDYNISLIKTGTRLLGVEAGDTTESLYGVAVDIGTTTIAAYLIDLTDGERLCVYSGLNPQKKFGADVISRIKHTIDSETGLEELNNLIINEINSCIGAMCEEANISRSDIYAITLVGNTTMTHFLLKVPAKNIAAAPFIPAVTSMVKINAKELGVDINPYGLAFVLPAVSAYIGADTVGAVLSTGMYEQEDISLLIDIGTNGEIVLGNREVLYACSSAAGPAFEGANIRNGIGSIKGAINSISLKSGVSYTTIGGAEPVGICGTGIVDGIAQLLEMGIVDETGRLDDEWEPATPEQASLAKNITVVDNMNAFLICGDIAITQKDIRELQNAKGAIAAGINVLVKQSGINFSDIKNVYLAGGFGTYINVDSALKIGLIPFQLRGKIQPVGNAAGQGAIEGLLSVKRLSDAEIISKKIKYIELSSSKDFNDFYMNCMMFE
ncbi:ASKHA domain-containing protein [Acetivibrio clariflavus]|uniref:Putative metal-binding protein n=1 Tax=Acetivibrio clariflavus (strain DSM 19732 / NBRC 101661 / EBR45) TaxID=720554 RepID=G8LVD2_ACECE|nr:ASKHA domain-containing protein [Acetivibrio clariflavus]AEV67486.1 putative metal-binding protein [Acetivibrio clariflavus DSM 19732]